MPKSPTFLGNFCEGVKIFHFSCEIIFGQTFINIWRFFLVTLLGSYKEIVPSYLTEVIKRQRNMSTKKEKSTELIVIKAARQYLIQNEGQNIEGIRT